MQPHIIQNSLYKIIDPGSSLSFSDHMKRSTCQKNRNVLPRCFRFLKLMLVVFTHLLHWKLQAVKYLVVYMKMKSIRKRFALISQSWPPCALTFPAFRCPPPDVVEFSSSQIMHSIRCFALGKFTLVYEDKPGDDRMTVIMDIKVS